ncbi:MAG: ABC transporter ATP-binding protein [Bacillota bacterium]
MEQEKSGFSYLAHFLKGHESSMYTAVVLAVLGSACGMIPYFVISIFITEILSGTLDFTVYLQLGMIALLGQLARLFFGIVSTNVAHKTSFGIIKNIRDAMTEKLSKVPMGYILNTPSGKFKTLFVDTVEKMEVPISHMIPEITAGVLIPISMIVYMFYLDWRMALVSLITIPVGFLCYMGMTKNFEVRFKEVMEAQKNMDASIVEYIGGIEVIKTFNQSKSSYEKYANAVTTTERVRAKWISDTNPYYIAGLAIMPSTLVCVLPVGAYFYMEGTLAGDTLITLIILALGIIKPLISVLQYTDRMASVDSTLKEVAELLHAKELERPTEYANLSGNDIVFENVGFAYDTVQVLNNVSFSTVPNGITAIVGPSGSGKSTITKLIASFWEVGSGRILLGGADMKNIPLTQVMEQVSYVSQDIFLFNLSIKENILMGKKNATDDEVIAAAKKAMCHDFIMSFPSGYDTTVGDAGGKLSGGERQRIALARAILKDSPVILLDEATAFTDPENEANIQKSISELIKGKTLIIVAHRLSTIVSADKILLLDKGSIQAEGTHEELLANSTLYHDLWTAHTDSATATDGGEK